jgi:hypothetical protein
MTQLVTIDQVWYHFRGNPIPLPLSTSWKATYNLEKYQYIICTLDIECNVFFLHSHYSNCIYYNHVWCLPSSSINEMYIPNML